MPDLVVKDLSKRFGDEPALDRISFTVNEGEFFTLLGPSGCGKSTTLASVAGLEYPDSGSISVGDQVFVDTEAGTFLPPEERNLGMVFQTYALWPHMTVEANLALPLKLRKVPSSQRKRRIDDALGQVDMEQYKHRYPHQLSGGQQQRVALARVLVYSPAVMLLDEPLSNLDAKLREQARAWLKDLQQRVGVTTVYVTHDQLEALSLSDRMAVMDQGRMMQVGTPQEIYERPESAQVAGFVGRCNFLTGKIEAQDEEMATVELDDGARVRVRSRRPVHDGATVTIGVRPERLEVMVPRDDVSAQSCNAIPAELRKMSYAGSRLEYEVDVAGQTIRADSERFVDGDQLWLQVQPEDAYLFPDSTPSGRAVDKEEVTA